MKWYKMLIYVLFYMSSTKNCQITAILTRFLFLSKIQDGDHSWCRHRPPAAPPPIKYTSSCWENQRLFTKDISKTLGRSFINPRFYHGVGMILLVLPRVKILRQITSTRVLHDKISTYDASVNLPNQRPSCRPEFLPELVCWSWWVVF